MKAIEINGSIKIYNNLPKTYGKVLSGFDSLSDNDLQNFGFYNVVIPEYDRNIQKVGEIYFDNQNNVFTYPVLNKTWSETLAQLKSSQIEKLKKNCEIKLNLTDWYVIRKSEKQIEIPEAIQTERDNTRSLCDTKESGINALTTKSAVVSYDISL
jgi:hypothetical protein